VFFEVSSFTCCGAPKYNVSSPQTLPVARFMSGLFSPDRKRLLDVQTGGDHIVRCYDLPSGRQLWSYPNQFGGVHGSHRAPPPHPGLLRGVFGAIGVAELPAPVGAVWVLNSNVGEWHMLTEDGFYLTKLFEGDPFKQQFPESAAPGAVMDACPPGLGGEDFGGSMRQGADGKIYLQAGKTALWNVEVVGMEKVRELPGDDELLEISDDDVQLAARLREQQMQQITGRQILTIARHTPQLSGTLASDFPGAQQIAYQKQEHASIRSAAVWDDDNLYLGWRVSDNTPWVNGAGEPALLFVGGDTVDFQLSAAADADPERQEAAMGDLRLSIGNFQGQATAVLYRKVSETKKQKTFSSGVVDAYEMDFVNVIQNARIQVRKENAAYTVVAAIPLEVLGLKPHNGLLLHGDFGATHGDPAGQRTRLRTFWNNQHTGIVDDVVFELKMQPQHWGELHFKD
jgi:hypothetical protein